MSREYTLGPVTRAEKAEAEAAKLTAELGKCYRLSGADPDGDSDQMLAPYAVQEVKRLRSEFDAVSDQLLAVEDLLRKAA